MFYFLASRYKFPLKIGFNFYFVDFLNRELFIGLDFFYCFSPLVWTPWKRILFEPCWKNLAAEVKHEALPLINHSRFVGFVKPKRRIFPFFA
ncbi:hypothetical protein CKQ87_28340 [Klebsiella pneumoniae]|nr:hypothetical protein CKQ87_28340 [Klebsiella pneumoniae]